MEFILSQTTESYIRHETAKRKKSLSVKRYTSQKPAKASLRDVAKFLSFQEICGVMGNEIVKFLEFRSYLMKRNVKAKSNSR